MIRPLNIELDYNRPNATWLLERIPTLDVTGMEVLATFRITIRHSPRVVGREGLDLRGRDKATFRLQISDAAGTLLLGAERIRLSDDMLARYRYDKRLPTGRLRVYAMFDKTFEPTRGIPTPEQVDGRDIGPDKRIRMEYIYP